MFILNQRKDELYKFGTGTYDEIHLKEASLELETRTEYLCMNICTYNSKTGEQISLALYKEKEKGKAVYKELIDFISMSQYQSIFEMPQD